MSSKLPSFLAGFAVAAGIGIVAFLIRTGSSEQLGKAHLPSLILASFENRGSQDIESKQVENLDILLDTAAISFSETKGDLAWDAICVAACLNDAGTAARPSLILLDIAKIVPNPSTKVAFRPLSRRYEQARREGVSHEEAVNRVAASLRDPTASPSSP